MRWAALSAIALSTSPLSARAMMPPLTGNAPPEVVQAIEEGLVQVAEPSEGLGTSTVRPLWRVPVVLVSYADSLLQFGPSEFNRMLFDQTGATATGSVYDYYQWVSEGRFTITGEVVATVRLPQTRAFYGNNSYGLSARESPNNAFGFVWDAITSCHRNVNWSDYDLDHDGFVDMLWVVHAGIDGATSQDRNNLWSITSRLTNGWRGGTFYTTQDPVPGSSTQSMRIDQFTVLPELSPFHRNTISEIGVYAHEFGHALGLPDLYTTALFTGQIDLGPGCWSLMSTGAYGLDAHSPQYPSHVGAWPLQYLGWDRTFRPDQDGLVTLDPLEAGGSILELWFQGESQSEHFLIENRQRISFDRNAPAEGLIIYHVDDGIIWQRLHLNSINSGGIPGLRVIEADGDEDMVVSRNWGDANDPFPGALNRTRIDDDTRPNLRTFLNARSNLALENITRVGQQMRFQARVHAIGWQAANDATGAGFFPVESHTLARSMGVDQRGEAHWVVSETRTGRPQVYLRSGRGTWGDPFQVSASTGSAMDPTVAVLPGGDLAIVWSDDREGHSQLWFRSRIQGVWTGERRLTNLPGRCQSPAISADSRGGLSLAFHHIEESEPQVRFMRFNWFSPFGVSMRVTSDDQVPGAPAVAAAANGISYIVWSDRSSSPQRLWFARHHPDSGMTGSFTLTAKPNVAQLDPSVVIDRLGLVHLVWQSSGPGNSQIHYQRRLAGMPFPLDTVLDTKGYLLQNPCVTIDSSQALHIVYESFPSATAEVRYLRSSPAAGWDAAATRLTNGDEGSATRPQALPASKDEVTVAYLQYVADGVRLRTRRRLLSGPAPLAVTVSRPASAPLRAGPNPIRAGEALGLWLAEAAVEKPVVEVFDVAGRRIAEASLERVGSGWVGALSASTTRAWPAGVVFARVPGTSTEQRLVVIR